MAHQLHAKGDLVGALIIIDSAPTYLIPPSPNGERRPVRRAISMARRGQWRGIGKKFTSLFQKAKHRINLKKEVTLNSLEKTIHTLNKMYVNYTWRPYSGKIILIRSHENKNRRDKRYHVRQWSKLTNDLEIKVVDGHHLTLFEEPEVQGLAKQISITLQAKLQQV